MEAELGQKKKGDILLESNTANNLFSPDSPVVDVMWSKTEASSDNLRNSSSVFLSFLVETCITEKPRELRHRYNDDHMVIDALPIL